MEILDPQTMSVFNFLMGIVSFIALIVFFAMSFNIGNIRKNLQSIQKMMEEQKEKE